MKSEHLQARRCIEAWVFLSYKFSHQPNKSKTIILSTYVHHTQKKKKKRFLLERELQASKSQVLASKDANVQISKLPTQAPTPKTSTSSPTVRKTPVPAPSPAMVNFPPSPPLASSKAPVSPPSSISTHVKAPGLAQSSTVLDRVGFAAGSVGSGFATGSVGSGFATGSAGSRFAFVLDLGLLLDLGSLPFWI